MQRERLVVARENVVSRGLLHAVVLLRIGGHLSHVQSEWDPASAGDLQHPHTLSTFSLERERESVATLRKLSYTQHTHTQRKRTSTPKLDPPRFIFHFNNNNSRLQKPPPRRRQNRFITVPEREIGKKENKKKNIPTQSNFTLTSAREREDFNCFQLERKE